MRTNELMIGNIVEIGGKPRQLRQIARRKVGYCPQGNPNRKYTHISEVRPIPITEELLAKNGFEREYDCICEYTYYIREIDGYFVEIKIGCSNMGDEYVNCHIDNCDRNSVASADIQYVHQLQNLTNIMNIKFDIKL